MDGMESTSLLFYYSNVREERAENLLLSGKQSHSALLQCPQPPWWGMGGQAWLGPIGSPSFLLGKEVGDHPFAPVFEIRVDLICFGEFCDLA